MSFSTDPAYEGRLRDLIRRDFAYKKLQIFNDELDSAYGQMRDSVWKKEKCFGILAAFGMGFYYGNFIDTSLKGNYLRKACFVIVSVTAIRIVESITVRYYTNYDLENKMIERYENQVLQNHPKLKENLSSQHSQRDFNFGNSQSVQMSNAQYQSNQKLNFEASQSQNSPNHDTNNYQFINSSNLQDLSWNQVTRRDERQFSDYSAPQTINWNSQNNWDKENSFSRDLGSKSDSFGSKAAPNKNEWNNHNGQYPENSTQDSNNIPYYPGVSPSH